MNFAEQTFQIAAIEFLALNGLLGVAVPNEGQRSRGAAGRAAAAGLRSGFQDLLVFDRKRSARGSEPRGLLCVAELKRPRRRKKRGVGLTARQKLRADQVDWAVEIRERGTPTFGPWDCLEDVVRDLESIGVKLKARTM